VIWILAMLVLFVAVLAAAFCIGWVSARDASANRQVEREFAEETTSRYLVGVTDTVAAPAVWPFPARGVARVPDGSLVEPVPDEERVGDDDYPYGSLPVVSADAPPVDPEAVAIWTTNPGDGDASAHARGLFGRLAGWWRDVREAVGPDRSTPWQPGELLRGGGAHAAAGVAEPVDHRPQHAVSPPPVVGRARVLPPPAVAQLAVLDRLWDLAAATGRRDAAVAR